MMDGVHEFLIRLVKDAGVPQVTLALRTGFSEKHVSQMMHGGGSVEAWDKLLLAAGVDVRYIDPMPPPQEPICNGRSDCPVKEQHPKCPECHEPTQEGQEGPARAG